MEQTESSGSWKGVIILAVIVAGLLLLIVNDVPGRLFDAQRAQAIALAADAYSRAEIARAQEAGHTERIQSFLIAFTGASPVVYALGGLLLGWWLRGREQRGA